MTKKIFFLLACLYMAVPCKLLAQVTDPEKQYTAFDMRHNGKIYVVVTVLLIILIGVLLYLVRLDRKITKLEKGDL
ncbi:MAG: CcmD family protein [Chitinophagaceae bacterium]